MIVLQGHTSVSVSVSVALTSLFNQFIFGWVEAISSTPSLKRLAISISLVKLLYFLFDGIKLKSKREGRIQILIAGTVEGYVRDYRCTGKVHEINVKQKSPSSQFRDPPQPHASEPWCEVIDSI